MPKPTDTPNPAPVPPVPLKEGRDLPLWAFQWEYEDRATFRYLFQAGWQTMPLSEVIDCTRKAFIGVSRCSDATLARIESTMKAHGVEWRDAE